MDGACIATSPTCPEYTYAPKAEVQPYFDIATNYGFANYMFSTHQGPSFPAHQFIFGGSSAPVFPGDNYFQYFVAEQTNGGCPASASGTWWIDPLGAESHADLNVNPWQCYDRNTLVTYQVGSTVYDRTINWPSQPAWKSYLPLDYPNDPLPGAWDAPRDDPQTCYFASSGGGRACQDSTNEYKNHVSVAQTHNLLSAPILTDIQSCQLPAISWVIPDEAWSDHPGPKDQNLGPDWVANIVDAICQSSTNSHHVCDYWGTDNTAQHIEPTAIFITWDDWGGFYDHVPPPAVYYGDPKTDTCPATTQNPNGWGCGYTKGFRVPLLVVSEWTPAATISGKLPSPGAPGFQHDFGSILAFTETNFTQQGLTLPPIAPAGGNPPYTYADQNTLDSTYNHAPAIPLWDFFTASSPRSFTYIPTTDSTHNAAFFQGYYQTPQNGVVPQPTGPEDGDPDD